MADSDPVKDGNNWYLYVNANPVNFVDPLWLVRDPLTGSNVSDDWAYVESSERRLGNGMTDQERHKKFVEGLKKIGGTVKTANEYYSAFSHSWDQARASQTIMYSAYSSGSPTAVSVAATIVGTKKALDYTSLSVDALGSAIDKIKYERDIKSEKCGE